MTNLTIKHELLFFSKKIWNESLEFFFKLMTKISFTARK